MIKVILIAVAIICFTGFTRLLFLVYAGRELKKIKEKEVATFEENSRGSCKWVSHGLCDAMARIIVRSNQNDSKYERKA